MDKRTLAAIGVAKATDGMMDLADMMDLAELNEICKYIVCAELVCHKKILLLTFYDIAELKQRRSQAVFRTFISKDDYITQDLRMSSIGKIKWLTGTFDNLYRVGLDVTRGCKYVNHKYIRITPVIFSLKSESDLAKSFIIKNMPELKNKQISTWDMINRFQERVREKRLHDKRAIEIKAIDDAMKGIKALPKRFYDWAENEALKDWRYVVYSPTSTRVKAECVCTYCKKTYTVNRKEILIKNNIKGVCPECGSEVVFKAKGRLASCSFFHRNLSYVEKTKTGFVFRMFYVFRRIHKSDVTRPETEYKEIQRTFYSFEDGEKKPSTRSYIWNKFKNTGIVRWCRDDNCETYLCLLYPYNLPKAWENTPMKYSALEILAREVPTEPLYYERAIFAYCNRPSLEWVIKMRLFNLAASLVNSSRSICLYLEEGKNIFSALNISKEHTKVLMEVDGSTDELNWLKEAENFGIKLNAELLLYLNKNFWTSSRTQILSQAGRKIVSLKKILKYIEKESHRYPTNHLTTDVEKLNRENMLRDWIAYLRWCDELGYDTSNKFYFMPNNFLSVHDRVAEEYRKYKDEIYKKRMEVFDMAIKNMSENHTEKDVFNLHKNGLFIRLPRDVDEIKKEGEALHHCVATYVEKVATRKTLIFFIRKEAEPDKPYYTLEWKGRVEQCRGSHNKAMTDEIKKFADYFNSEMIKYFSHANTTL